MTCSNCFNNCAEIQPDKCIKYTGDDVTSLGISSGDSLLVVEQQLAAFLVTALDGTGIIPDVTDTCTLLNIYLPSSGDITLNDFISALIQAACNLQSQVTAAVAKTTIIEGEYTIDCLSGVTKSSGTHDILQAVITKLCSIDDDVTAITLDVATNYVKLSDLNSLIAAYIASSTSGTSISSRMVPYSAVEYYGSLSNFDASGAGIGDWADIYLCNGNNGTPDKRGRVSVCATTGMGGGAYSSVVDPSISGNPTYSLYTLYGANNVTLTSISQIPSHTHVATPTVTITPHSHLIISSVSGTYGTLTSTNYVNAFNNGSGADYTLKGTSTVPTLGKTSTEQDTVSVSISNSYAGGTTSHNNVQPSIACYYIMYIPS